jgi:NADH:ubiquinone oxidoreductase subunit 6 (subunit J)
VLQATLPVGAVGVAFYFAGLSLRQRADPARYRGWLKATLALMAAGLVLRVAIGGGAP